MRRLFIARLEAFPESDVGLAIVWIPMSDDKHECCSSSAGKDWRIDLAWLQTSAKSQNGDVPFYVQAAGLILLASCGVVENNHRMPYSPSCCSYMSPSIVAS